VDALAELVDEGRIGSVSPAPAIARLVAEDRPDVVLYAPV